MSPIAAEVWTMGELLVEVMRPRPGLDLGKAAPFIGPFPSGAPGIFIDTAARLGHSAAIISGVGDDEFGRCILERFRADGVATDLVRVFPNRSTGVAFVMYEKDGSRKFIFHWDGTPAVMAEVPDASEIASARFFHVMGCSLMANDAFRERVFGALELFRSRGARISFDPNIRFELLAGRPVDQIAGPLLRSCSILFPGEREVVLLSGEETVERAVASLFARYPMETIVLKRGRKGCTVFQRRGSADGIESFDVPAFRVREVDPTGAGDCFDAGFLCGILEGKDPRESARLASAVGALNAQAFGPMEGRITAQRAAAMLRRRRA
ncbi:MAG TPA: sugar kinase [Spirochaetia bacterium]|nr:sugar kinase [Spirochaetia bacterium]